MKRLILASLLAFPCASCSTLDSLLDVPAAVATDVGGAVDAASEVVTPAEKATADTAGQVAATGTTILTGNAALGAAAGSLVTLLASFLIQRRKKS